MQATGGSGTYIWSCDPEGVVGVGVNGTLEVLEQGVTMVYAADVRNTAHYNQSEVSKVFLFNFCNYTKIFVWHFFVMNVTIVERVKRARHSLRVYKSKFSGCVYSRYVK